MGITLASRRLHVAAWLPDGEWEAAPEFVRKLWVDSCCRIVHREKLRQLERAIGANGKRLKPRKHRRADGADGPVLTPHDASSRARRYLRCIAGYRAGTVTPTWSGRILKILGYHAEGRVRGAPVRNVLEFPPAIVARIKSQALAEWRSLARTYRHLFRSEAPAREPYRLRTSARPLARPRLPGL